MEQQQKHRPLGVTIIAVLTIIAGIAFLASGITAVTVAPFLSGTYVIVVIVVKSFFGKTTATTAATASMTR